MPVVLIGSSLVSIGWAQSKTASRRASGTALKMQSQGQGTLTVALTTSPDGVALAGSGASPRTMNLGSVSYASGPRTPNVQMTRFEGRFVVSARFGLSIQDPSQRIASASVLASMALPEAFFTLRLDGVRLDTLPQIIQGRARVGPTLPHRLEIEVPTSLTEQHSQLQNSIVFQVIPN